MQIQDLVCQWCGETTTWPVENEIEMTVYAVGHVIDCPSAPIEVRAEAIAFMEQARTTGNL